MIFRIVKIEIYGGYDAWKYTVLINYAQIARAIFIWSLTKIKEKLRKDKITGVKAATDTHYMVGKEVRGAIEKIGGIMPEDLPTPEKSIQ